jgi:hypothetical protein
MSSYLASNGASALQSYHDFRQALLSTGRNGHRVPCDSKGALVPILLGVPYGRSLLLKISSSDAAPRCMYTWLRKRGGAPRNPAHRSHFWEWIAKPRANYL